MKNKVPVISDSEWQVMKVIWGKNEAKSSEIVAKLYNSTKWSDKTIITLLNRLVNKGVLATKKDSTDGRAYVYYPLITEQECLEVETTSFLQKCFNGTVKDLMLNIIDTKSLTKSEIEELKSILDTMEEKKND
jgi:BlaI family penicillinase repressor